MFEGFCRTRGHPFAPWKHLPRSMCDTRDAHHHRVPSYLLGAVWSDDVRPWSFILIMVRSVRVYRMVLSGDIFAVILPGVTFTLIFITKLDLIDSRIFIINQN